MSETKPAETGREKIARIVAEMTDPLRAKYQEIRKLLAELTAHDVRSRHKIGLLVREIHDDRDKLYGTQAVGKLAESFGLDEDTLYRYATVAETWNEEQIVEILKRENIHGRPLSWSHLVALAKVSDAEEREQFLAKAIDEGLSVRELESLIDRPASPSRTTRTIPAPVDSGLRRMIAESQAVTSHSAVWAKTVFDRLDTLSPSQFSKGLRQTLESARDGQLEAQEVCHQNVAKLNSYIAKVGAALTGKKGRAPKTVPLRSSKPKAVNGRGKVARKKTRRSKSA
jgi:hypothetical protein